MISDALTSWLSDNAGREVVFFSNPGNAGDAFIAYATFKLFAAHRIHATIGAPGTTYGGNEHLVFGGGGNLIEGLYTDTSNLLSRYLGVNRCTVLPQSVVGFKDLLSRPDARLQLFCRENASYNGVIANGIPTSVAFLVHDITLYLEDDHFSDFWQSGRGTAFVMRTDRESSHAISPLPAENLDISRSWDGDFWSDRRFTIHATLSLCSYLARFAEVHTDRLHVAILGGFLNKKVAFYANSYFKNRAVYEASLRDRFPHVRFVEDGDGHD